MVKYSSRWPRRTRSERLGVTASIDYQRSAVQPLDLFGHDTSEVYWPTADSSWAIICTVAGVLTAVTRAQCFRKGSPFCREVERNQRYFPCSTGAKGAVFRRN